MDRFHDGAELFAPNVFFEGALDEINGASLMTDTLETSDISPAACAPSHDPRRPRLALRIGVTGGRSLDGGRLAELREKLHEVLNSVREDMQRLAKEDGVAVLYAGADQDGPSPLLRFLSPLARGTDRLAAEVALQLGYELYVPMPFPRAEYQKDFSGSQNPTEPPLTAAEDLAQFETLLQQADDACLSLDGNHEDQTRAYEAVGRFVARHSDLLIAIWDGKPAAGRGGTAEIIEYAVSNGVPVWWIHATETRTPVWLADIEDLRDPRPLPSEPPVHVLRTYLEKHIRPPAPVPRHRHGLVGRLARLGQQKHVLPVADYYAEDANPPGSWSRAYSLLMRLASRCNLPWTEPVPPKDLVAGYWFDLYDPTDRRAGEYAARYRSSYVWLFILATATLIFGASAAVAHGHKGWVLLSVGLEALMLGGICFVVIAAIRGDWHERSIEYRLLAELCRKQQVLAPLGRAVSLGAVRRMVLRGLENAAQGEGASAEPRSDAEPSDRSAWVAWLFAAWERAAPLPRGDIAAALPEIVRRQVLEGLIEEQLDYHRRRADMSELADETFFRVGQWSFIAVCICVALKLAAVGASFVWPEWSEKLIWEYIIHSLTWLAIILPAVSAAALGIRSYAELQLLVEQSRHMEEELLHAKRRMERVNLKRALAAEDIGTETHAVASLMLQDLEGWSRLFKVKAIEP